MTGTSTGTDEFRARARDWLAANAPRTPVTGEDEARAFQAKLFDAGLAGITWPKAYGGQGLSTAEQRAFDEEAKAYELPFEPFMIGLGMVGPTILDLGTEEQKTTHLPPLLRGERIWCQLFSEPGAGSDVAGLTTRAVLDGAEWVLDGQKVWTSRAHYSDWGAIIARTDPGVRKHRGITMFLADMHAPGVTVRPLVDMSGGTYFNEVFFDSVRVPADAVVGEVGQGWSAAVTMLGHERVTIGARMRPKDSPTSHATLAALAKRRGIDTDPAVARKLTELYVLERGSELFATRLGQEQRAGKAPGSRGSVGKLAGGRIARFLQDVSFQVAGPGALTYEPDDAETKALVTAVLKTPSARIAGGSDEIQRGIIADRVLGLPKEPSVDRDLPFSEIPRGPQA
ncbi:MAG: dehydrogenase [Streptosporangiales bacterium]|nr:dehydrogenase [Streptosporangiales bacterium]